MEGLFEIPKYVRYDFLISLIGVFCLGAGWYFTFVIKIDSQYTGILFVIGTYFLIWGWGEMYSNYRDERDLNQLKILLEKKTLFDELMKQKILDKTQTNFLISILKKDVKEIIEKRA